MGKKTANPHYLTYEVSGHQLAMKWGQGCGCLFSIICSAVEQGQSANDEVGTGVWMPLQQHMLGCGAGPGLKRNPDRISVFAPSPADSMRKSTGRNSQANETERISHRQESTVFLLEASFVCVCVIGVLHTVPTVGHQMPKVFNNLAVMCGKLGKGEVCA